MTRKIKITFGIITCFALFTLIFGLCGIPIEGSFITGIKVGLFVDVIVGVIILIAKVIDLMINLK